VIKEGENLKPHGYVQNKPETYKIMQTRELKEAIWALAKQISLIKSEKE